MMKSGRVVFYEGAKGHPRKGMIRRKGARRSKGINTTVIVPRWQKDLRAGVRGLKKEMLYILAAIGACWVGWQVLLWIGAAIGGG